MEENLFSKVDIKPENVNFLDGNVEPVAESARYAQAIKNAGGIDIQLLGIGRNGHIGFNERLMNYRRGIQSQAYR